MTDRDASFHCAPEVTLLTTTADVGMVPVERPALDAIYEEYADFLYAVLRRLGLGEAQAEDALQDVFIVVHRRIESFEGRGTMRSWLYGIAVRVAREHRRRRGLRRRFFELFGAGEAERVVDERRPDPEAALETNERLRQLDRLLDALPEERREVFVLVEVAGFTGPEAAECLGIELNTAYSRLRLARADVKAALKRARAEEARRSP